MKKLIALLMVLVLAVSFAACTTEPAETDPVETEPTEATEYTRETLDPASYKEFIGTWYADGSSAGYRIDIQEGDIWACVDPNKEVTMSGILTLGDEPGTIVLYDNEGGQALLLTLEEANKVYADIISDTLIETLETTVFYNEITNNSAVGDDPVDYVDDSANHVEEEAIPSDENDLGAEEDA